MSGIVVGMGEVLWDMLPEGKKLGGAPANFACHVSQLGFDSCVVSAVGNDELGKAIAEQLSKKNINMLVSTVPYPTGTVQVSLKEKGVPCYDITQNVAWDNIPFTNELKSLAEKTVAVCFGSLAQRSEVSRAAVNGFLSALDRNICRYRVFDVNLRQKFYTREILNASMERCNILKINDEELVELGAIFGYHGEIESVCREIREDYNLDMLILTCGEVGSYIFYDSKVSYQETPVVKVADTVGAGDSFTAAFVVALLKDMSVEDAHKNAVKVSAYVCTREGAVPEIPDDLKF